MLTNPDKACLLTAPGVSALAVIRISGPRVTDFLSRRFDRKLRPGCCVHGNLSNNDGIIDDPVIAWVSDDAVDINLHGGTAVVRMVLDLAHAEGFAINPPPPVPTNLEDEVTAELPYARTESAVRALLAQPQAWKNLSPIDHQKVAADTSGQWLVRPPTVAIVGPANVGKSTLANRLFGQTRAIVADVPGTTRDWVGAIADLGGLAVMLMDTPGIRTTDDQIEIAAVAASAQEIRSADLVIVVIDTSVPQSPETRAVLDQHHPAIVVGNKADKPAVWNLPGSVAISAETGFGVDDLMTKIRRHFGWEPFEIDRPRCWTARQRAVLDDQTDIKGSDPFMSASGVEAAGDGPPIGTVEE